MVVRTVVQKISIYASSRFSIVNILIHLLFHFPSLYMYMCSVQLLSRVQLFATPWIAARQASLSITISRSSLRLKSIESMMPSSHLILCHPLFLLPPIPPSIRVFSNESTLHMRWPKYWVCVYTHKCNYFLSFFESKLWNNAYLSLQNSSKYISWKTRTLSYITIVWLSEWNWHWSITTI